MKKITFIFLLLISITWQSSAKEGMWIPMLLEKLNASEMNAMGLRITTEEIYSLNQSSLKDAIVHFGGGCTAELVSGQGLLLTNHHCGYRNIQKHSSVEHDYLTDGFWAKTMNDELKNPGLQAKILTYMSDVSDQVLDGVNAEMSETERQSIIQKNIQGIKKENDNSKFHKVDVKAFYYGNQYIMMKYDVFFDVRLVGAPPSNIGKFGGDTDNWMWPRHTGDFSVFRIYANKDNQPTDISADNVPYQPKKHLSISLKGVQEGDFTFIFGYPGRTQKYVLAKEVEFITKTQNPFKIDLRRQKLDIMSKAMDNDPKIRIQYSAKYAGVANGWKKWIGENKGIKRMNSVFNKNEMEKEFVTWAMENSKANSNIVQQANSLYESRIPYEMAYTYFVEAAYYHDLTRYASAYRDLVEQSENEEVSDSAFTKRLEDYKSGVAGFYKDYNVQVDKDIFIASIKAYYAFPYGNVERPAFFSEIATKNNNSVEKFADGIYKKSVFASEEKLTKFLNKANRKSIKKLKKDPMYKYAFGVFTYFANDIRPKVVTMKNKSDSLQRLYMAALLEYKRNDRMYPDANSTLRVSYGRVEGYFPRDGVEYTYFTTLDGIMAKENPNIYDYVVEPQLKKLYNNKDYGEYADMDGSMHVCFIASNHTTGGNSGSPALDADGNLIGINFDRNWEGTMSDLNYDPDQCRNIMLDIRYCLFIIDKYAGANHLIEEMTFVR